MVVRACPARPCIVPAVFREASLAGTGESKLTNGGCLIFVGLGEVGTMYVAPITRNSIAVPADYGTSSSTRMKKKNLAFRPKCLCASHWRRLGDADVGVQTMTRPAVWMTGLTGGSPAVQQGSR